MSDKPKTCEWKCYSGFWFKTKCGHQSLYPPNYKFCPFCGGKIVEVKDKETEADYEQKKSGPKSTS